MPDEDILGDIESEDGEDLEKEDSGGEADSGKKKSEGEDDDKEQKERRSEIIQKIKYRDRAKQAETKVEKLQADLEELRKAVKKPGDEAERKAQEFIRNQATEVYKQLEMEKAKEERKILDEFNDALDDILETNPDIAEDELLDICEEFKVEPKTALAIIKRGVKGKEEKPKPRMPQAKRGSGEPSKKKVDDKGKTFHQISKELAEEAKEKNVF